MITKKSNDTDVILEELNTKFPFKIYVRILSNEAKKDDLDQKYTQVEISTTTVKANAFGG